MPEQPIVTYADFAAQAENEKWSKDRAVLTASQILSRSKVEKSACFGMPETPRRTVQA